MRNREESANADRGLHSVDTYAGLCSEAHGHRLNRAMSPGLQMPPIQAFPSLEDQDHNHLMALCGSYRTNECDKKKQDSISSSKRLSSQLHSFEQDSLLSWVYLWDFPEIVWVNDSKKQKCFSDFSHSFINKRFTGSPMCVSVARYQRCKQEDLASAFKSPMVQLEIWTIVVDHTGWQVCWQR